MKIIRALIVVLIVLSALDAQCQNWISFRANKDSRIKYTSTYSKALLYYSTNAKDWVILNSSKELNIKNGEIVYVRGICPKGLAFNNDQYSHFQVDGDVEISGNIMALLNYKSISNSIPDYPYCFYKLFAHSDGITSVSKTLLPATEIAPRCYQYMFAGCRNLKNAPDLPSQKTAFACYSNMFNGCENMEQGPNISAKKLEYSRCMEYMFAGCKNLKTITVEFDIWDPITETTSHWVEGLPEYGEFIHPSDLVEIYGISFMPYGKDFIVGTEPEPQKPETDNPSNPDKPQNPENSENPDIEHNPTVSTENPLPQMAHPIDIKVYPNPSHENEAITIELSNTGKTIPEQSNIYIFNPNGDLIIKLNRIQKTNHINLKSGIYYGILTGVSPKQSFKIIVL